MTTLPQTTNVRLPRPVSGPMQLAPGQHGALATSQGGSGQPPQTNEMWRVLRSHIWLILITVFLIAPAAGVGANFYLSRYYPKYTAAGFVQVQPMQNPNVLK